MECEEAYFKVKLRSVSGSSVEFLDLIISVENGRLFSRPTLDKDPRPLCVHSAHSQKVHRAWPEAVARRAYDLGGLQAVHKLVEKYKQVNTHPATLNMFNSISFDSRPREKQANSKIACILGIIRLFKELCQ